MSGPVFLVDGISLANRDQVVKAIALQYKDNVEVYDCREHTPAHLYVRMMADALDHNKAVIIEVSWFAQRILASMGEKSNIAEPMARMLDRIALGVNAQIAYCLADGRTYAKNIVAAGLGTYESYKASIDKMDAAWAGFDYRGIPVTKIFTSDSQWGLDIEALVTKANLACKINVGPGIGNWNPGKVTLLVGDRHGPSIQPYKVDLNLAFCDMAKAGASYWLSQQLDRYGILESDLYWINAFDINDVATDPSFIERLQPKTILSLGDSAARWCERFNLRHEPFSHPQYHRRFKSSDVYLIMLRLQELKS